MIKEWLKSKTNQKKIAMGLLFLLVIGIKIGIQYWTKTQANKAMSQQIATKQESNPSTSNKIEQISENLPDVIVYFNDYSTNKILYSQDQTYLKVGQKLVLKANDDMKSLPLKFPDLYYMDFFSGEEDNAKTTYVVGTVKKEGFFTLDMQLLNNPSIHGALVVNILGSDETAPQVAQNKLPTTDYVPQVSSEQSTQPKAQTKSQAPNSNLPKPFSGHWRGDTVIRSVTNPAGDVTVPVPMKYSPTDYFFSNTDNTIIMQHEGDKTVKHYSEKILSDGKIILQINDTFYFMYFPDTKSLIYSMKIDSKTQDNSQLTFIDNTTK